MDREQQYIIQLEDMVAAYPDTTTNNFQTLISNKKEFAELASHPSEPRPSTKGEYYKHQTLIQRYMRFYDSCILIHDTGTGKSCTISAVAEYFKKNHQHIRHVYFLTNGTTQKDDFKRQLTCICSDGSYETDRSKTASDESSQKAAITREVKKWYTVTTYKTFAKHINRSYTGQDANERIRDYYSGCIFFVDEIQNLRINVETEHRANRERGDIYNALWKLFHLVDRSKVMIASATPMVKDVSEMGPHLNLILPLNMQINNPYMETLIKKTGIQLTGPAYNLDLSIATLDQLLPLLQGRVSYVRGLMTGAVPVYGYNNPANKINHIYNVNGRQVQSSLVLDKLRMSNFQSRAYFIAAGNQSTNLNEAIVSKNNSIFSSHRQAALFIFPDGSWGDAGFKKYVIEKDGRYRANEELSNFIANSESFMSMSIKHYTIVARSLQEAGKRYIYTNIVRGGGGIMLGICLEIYGFELYKQNTSAFSNTGSGVRPFCPDGKNSPTQTRQVRRDIPKKNRYAIISRMTTDAEKASIFELYNSPENLNGEYIKDIIISPVGQFGINISDVMHVDMLTPDWNPSNTYQSINRAFRSTSHEGTIEAKKRELMLSGGNTDDVRVEVNVHLYVTYYSLDGNNYQETVEPIMYKASEYKDYFIHRMMRILKQASFDCQIHRARNIRDTDIDYSPVCDYDLCKYQCANPTPQGEIDTGTYDVYYSDEIIDQLTGRLIEYFRKNISGSIENFRQEMPDVLKNKYFYMALEKMISNRTRIYNRFGFTSYIRENDGIFSLTKVYPRVNENFDYASSYYGSNLIGVESLSLNDIITQLDALNVVTVIEDLKDIPIQTDEFYKTVQDLNTESKARLLEDAIIKEIKGQDDQVSAAIRDYFKNSYFALREPVTDIKAEANKMHNKTKRGTGGTGGKTDNKPTRIRPEDMAFTEETDTPIVYVHNIHTSSSLSTGYAVVTRFLKGEGRIRIYKESEGEWRDVNEYENAVYNRILQHYVASLKKTYNDNYPIHGIVADNKFIVRDARYQNPNMEFDMKYLRQGMQCKSYNKDHLVDIMYNIGMKPRNPESITRLIPRDHKLRRLEKSRVTFDTSDWSDEKLDFFYSWYESVHSKAELCYYIAVHMINQTPPMVFSTAGNAVEQVKLMIQKDGHTVDEYTQKEMKSQLAPATFGSLADIMGTATGLRGIDDTPSTGLFGTSTGSSGLFGTSSSNTGSSNTGSSNPLFVNTGSSTTGSSNPLFSNTGSSSTGSSGLFGSSTGSSNPLFSNTGSSTLNTGSSTLNTGSSSTGSSGLFGSSTGSSTLNTGSSNTGSGGLFGNTG